MGTFLCAITLFVSTFPCAQASAREHAEAENAPVVAMVHFMHEINPGLAAPLGFQYARAVIADAQTNQIDPCLLLAVVGVESHFKSEAVSKHGAIGLGQLLPSTAQSLHVDPTLPLSNLRGTSQYLRSLLDRFAFLPGHERTAIAAYNAGPGAIARNHGDPTSQANAIYVERVFSLWQSAKQRLGSFIAPQTVAAHSDAGVTGESLAHKQTSWWTSEGSSDPITAVNTSLTRHILHL